MTTTLLTTRQLADARGVTRQAITQAVNRGSLTPAVTLANGNYLFTEDQIADEAGA